MIENIETVEKEQLCNRVHRLLDDGQRFVTITCCNNHDGSFDLFYSFNYQLKLTNLKLTVQKEVTIPSISGICIAAAFAENEIGELFGLKFEGLVIDYGGRFILTEDTAPEPFGQGLIIVNKDKDGGKNA